MTFNQLFSQYLLESTYWFDRPFYEKFGASHKEVDGKIHFFINALGVNKDDLVVRVEATEHPSRNIVFVSGKTERKDFSSPFGFSYKIPTRKPVDEVKLESFDAGLLEISLSFKEPVQPDVKISL